MGNRADTHLRNRSLERLIHEYRLADPVMVTQPTMPDLDDYHATLREVWERRWLTNDGELHRELEQRLAEYLDVEHLSLFCNGTIALMVALQALDIERGEIITTPFTFPASVHVLHWQRIHPVFCDIDENTFCLDPDRIEQLIGPETRAIMAVHVYGIPCNVEAIQRIADAHGLRVIYDAAHAFGVRHKDRSILTYGDISALSFHATKLFSTGEGGALISNTDTQKKHIDLLKNFGIADEETIVAPGINGKMSELQAAYGLLQLKMVDQEIARRSNLSHIYQDELKNIPGISIQDNMPDTERNYAYFPILIDEESYGSNRDELYNLLKKFNIYSRKYFSPLCSQYPCYSALPSAAVGNLPVADRISRQVLCLPIYGGMEAETAARVARIIKEIFEVQ